MRKIDDNWIYLLDKYEHLIGSRYAGEYSSQWVFSGLLHGEDDSCVGDLEMAGFKLRKSNELKSG